MPDDQYVWNYYRCSRCHDYLVVVRMVEGVYLMTLKCNTFQCLGELVLAEKTPVPEWPATIIRTATAEWYRPPENELRLMKKMTPKLYRAVVEQNRLVLRKLDEPMVWMPNEVASE